MADLKYDAALVIQLIKLHFDGAFSKYDRSDMFLCVLISDAVKTNIVFSAFMYFSTIMANVLVKENSASIKMMIVVKKGTYIYKEDTLIFMLKYSCSTLKLSLRKT